MVNYIANFPHEMLLFATFPVEATCKRNNEIDDNNSNNYNQYDKLDILHKHCSG